MTDNEIKAMIKKRHEDKTLDGSTLRTLFRASSDPWAMNAWAMENGYRANAKEPFRKTVFLDEEGPKAPPVQ